VHCEQTDLDARELVPLVVVGLLLFAMIVTCVRLQYAKEERRSKVRQYKEPPKERVKRILAKLTVKLKIVIANQQVLQGLGAVYDIQCEGPRSNLQSCALAHVDAGCNRWPFTMKKVLEYLAFLNFDFVELLPIGCEYHKPRTVALALPHPPRNSSHPTRHSQATCEFRSSIRSS
jgi:hypothetical protein